MENDFHEKNKTIFNGSDALGYQRSEAFNVYSIYRAIFMNKLIPIHVCNLSASNFSKKKWYFGM